MVVEGNSRRSYGSRWLPVFTKIFPHASCLRMTDGRRYSRGLLTYSLPFLSSHSEEKKLRYSNQFANGAKVIRVVGRSYPPLYRAHKWVKGGWTYLRPSPFGVYVGLPNRDLHRPKRENKHKPYAGPLKHKCETLIIQGEEEEWKKKSRSVSSRS